MTKQDRPRCAWCGERFKQSPGPGRPQRFCRRSHRQRAFEARKLADERGLADDEILVTAKWWAALRDVVYLAEATARDAVNDLVDDPTKGELMAMVDALVGAIEQVVGVSLEPKAVGDR